ncbi:hypothetical protein ACCO45_011226 [Purpureocillium lilacinum]|uniref:Uncharacterized protein n=1 Tax=Purpureocillium lilacinum TaxID=33203 RepID=A0ACC4DHU4_PURLI
MADRFPNTPGQTATDLGQQRPKGRVQRRFKHAAERDGVPVRGARRAGNDRRVSMSRLKLCWQTEQQQIGHETGGQATASSSRQGWCVHAAYCTLHLGLTDAWALAGTVFTARHMLLAGMALPGKAAQILRRQGLLTRHSRRIGPGKAVTLVGRRRTLELAREACIMGRPALAIHAAMVNATLEGWGS